jgi:hypothetical protein
MDKQSPGGVAEVWRKQGFSGQTLGRMAMGVASRGGTYTIPAQHRPG